VLGLGPAVLYRRRAPGATGAAGPAPRRTGQHRAGRATQAAWAWIDWLPACCTALALAIVGSFEDAIDAWRRHAERFGNERRRDPGGGRRCRGVRWATCRPVRRRWAAAGRRRAGRRRRELPGEAPSVAHFARVVGLVWRMVACGCCCWRC
jgi:adenosylcobinamide-phosphate synthase